MPTIRPTVADPWRRAARTFIATGIPAIIAFAGFVPTILDQAHKVTSPELYQQLAAVGGFIVAGAALMSRIMATPAFNQLLSLIGLGADTTTETADDPLVQEIPTETRVLQLSNENSGEFMGPPAH